LSDPRINYRPSNSCFFQIRIAQKRLVLEKTRSAAAAKTIDKGKKLQGIHQRRIHAGKGQRLPPSSRQIYIFETSIHSCPPSISRAIFMLCTRLFLRTELLLFLRIHFQGLERRIFTYCMCTIKVIKHSL